MTIYLGTLSRLKRGASTDRRFCSLHFIADYSFYSNVGGSDFAKTVDIIVRGKFIYLILFQVKAFNRVNEVFLSSEFFDPDETNRSHTGFGFYLKGVGFGQKRAPPLTSTFLDFYRDKRSNAWSRNVHSESSP